jgi:hypothetical protein
MPGEPLHRPWMTFIKVNNRKIPQCGGSIINNYWILSAGHCFCERLKCKPSKGGNFKIDFKPQDHIQIITGLTDLDHYYNYNYNAPYQVSIPKKIFIHPL